MKDTRTYRSRAAYLIRAVAKRRKKLRAMALAHLGGKCVVCGYAKSAEALEFHHRSGKKDFGISEKGMTRSWVKIERELKKCVLLCANCHREVHHGLTQLPAVTQE
jgi:hypothetical protein